MGALAKTDKVDARMLRDFGDVLSRYKHRSKYVTPMFDPARELLHELVTRRRQLVEMRVAEGNHLEHATKATRRGILSVAKLLDKQIAQIDKEIDDHMDDHFKPQKELLDSFKGVGPATIMTLVADLPELGKLDRRAIAKLTPFSEAPFGPVRRWSTPRSPSRAIICWRTAYPALTNEFSIGSNRAVDSNDSEPQIIASTTRMGFR